MKKKVKINDNLFVRFGKLHLTKQKGFGGDTFHSPPSTIGFYAMPFKYQDFFLISSLARTQSEQLNIPKELFNYDGDDEEIYKKREKYLKDKISKLRHEFYVDDDTLVWHHLTNVKRNEIVDTHNSWIKTTITEYKKALKKEIVLSRAYAMKMCNIDDINSIPKNYINKDIVEVFFDTKVY